MRFEPNEGTGGVTVTLWPALTYPASRTALAGSSTRTAPSTADRPRRQSAMNHSVSLGAPLPDSPRGNALKATLALQHLLSHDLPGMCVWRVDGIGHGGDYFLAGQLANVRDDSEIRAEMARWVEFLGAQVASKRKPGSGTWLTIDAVYWDVTVTVYAVVNRPKRKDGEH